MREKVENNSFQLPFRDSCKRQQWKNPRCQAFNSLFGIQISILFERDDITNVFQLPFRDSKFNFCVIVIWFYNFQLPFRDSALTGGPLLGTATTLSTPFSGFFSDVLVDTPVLDDFQLPFRDSIFYFLIKPGFSFFQLPFRDSSLFLFFTLHGMG